MGASHPTLYKAHVCFNKLGVLHELLSDAYGGSEGRIDFLAAIATPPLRLGHMVLAEKGVHPDGYGRERLGMGRGHDDHPYGNR